MASARNGVKNKTNKTIFGASKDGTIYIYVGSSWRENICCFSMS
ncbi:hypothetical protein CCACVL1_28894 [Corchorus capsularis]|uniref:Uncharacterized protein n=1 Tax=Corchorus capsularis TaxID=210143 RepID=A0A1R3G4R6_COCAP|nr:hypothetical protein CCACVL1_28894 [Corchorus capsularis]